MTVVVLVTHAQDIACEQHTLYLFLLERLCCCIDVIELPVDTTSTSAVCLCPAVLNVVTFDGSTQEPHVVYI